MVQNVPIAPLPPERFREVLTPEQAAVFDDVVIRSGEAFAGRVIWNVNSTAAGGGVAEMLHSLIAYARGANVDARWVVIEGNEDFFHITKRMHNLLHGVPGDGGDLGPAEREIYDAVMDANAGELTSLVAPGDIVLVHDPQPAGLIAALREAGAYVVWRCHIGIDNPNDLVRRAWDFLRPYVLPADAYVFSRESYEWDGLDRNRSDIIPPSIDAFSPKNQALSEATVGAILRVAGLSDHDHHADATFTHQDGTPGRVDRSAKIWESTRIPLDAPLVVQVSRWDRLKDPDGVIAGFTKLAAEHTPAHLLLAGPDVTAVADDPEGLEVLNECIDHWQRLPGPIQERVHLTALPMDDAEENAAIVNAIQRHASVVVQKSLAEGFGLTVAEAMWKARPVVASRIGGIQDQIVDGTSGLLVESTDLDAYALALMRVLEDPLLADRLGHAAQTRVRDSFLGSRHLGQYLDLLSRVVASRPVPVA